jgi:hypothetical protein
LAAADFAVADLGLVIEPSALAAARRSLEEPGFFRPASSADSCKGCRDSVNLSGGTAFCP